MKSSLSSQHSLSRQLFKAIFGLYCVIAISVTAIQIFEEYRQTKVTITAELKTYQKIFGPVLAKALWNLDREQVNDIIKGLSEVPIVVGIKIERLQGDKLIPYAGRKSKQDNNTLNNQFSYSFPIEYTVAGALQPLGQATLYSDSSIVLGRVKVGFAFLIINALIKGIFLWLIFWWFSKKLLIVPLNKLIQSITNVKFDNLANFHIDLNIKNENELSLIEDSFTNMVAELSKAKQDVTDFNQRLEKKVKQRTFELEKAKNEAEALTHIAESATQAKSTFLATVSHELRTPMNGIQGMLYLLEQGSLDEKQQYYTEVASSSAKRLLTLIDEILDLSKAEAGKFTLDNSIFEVYPIFNELIKSFELLESENKEIEIRLDADKIQDLQAIGDPLRLRQILINLLGNARKFTKQGQITITATLRDHPDLNREKFYLTVAVQDTGIGIAEKNMGHLFDSFSQADSSTTREYGGSGLGLAICKQLCELMEGEIEVSSKEGVGSCFTFYVVLGRVSKTIASPFQ